MVVKEQRVWIAMALAQRTDILFRRTNHIFRYLSSIRNTRISSEAKSGTRLYIVMVLHDINQAIRFSDHLIAKEGDIIATGSTEDVLTQEILEKVLLMLF